MRILTARRPRSMKRGSFAVAGVSDISLARSLTTASRQAQGTPVIWPKCGRVNPDGAWFCMACASPLEAEERGLAEERKVVTVVFVDLVGFTARAERLDPEDVRGVLAPYHARLRAELERHGGTVEKFIGDAVMTVLASIIDRVGHPYAHVRAAMALQASGNDAEAAAERARGEPFFPRGRSRRLP
jgi:Adenylate and Guanylate cyclase catalytic domain